LRERSALEAADGNRERPSKPSPQLAALERELSDVIESRNTLGSELDDLLGTGQSESDEDYIPNSKAANAVRCPAFLAFSFAKARRF